MNSTNVPSSKNNEQKVHNIAPVGAQTIPTENKLEIPPKAAKWGISENELMADQGIEIAAQTSRVNEKGILEKQDGTTIAMVNPKAYQNLLAAKNKRKEMKAKAEEKLNKVQVGMEESR